MRLENLPDQARVNQHAFDATNNRGGKGQGKKPELTGLQLALTKAPEQAAPRIQNAIDLQA
jgi:hypothetical protein